MNHKLDDFRRRFKKEIETKKRPSTWEDPYRATGRSTEIALRLIHQAYANPRLVVNIRDHHEGQRADRFLLEQIRDYVEKLGFDGFTFHMQKLTMVYEITPWEKL